MAMSSKVLAFLVVLLPIIQVCIADDISLRGPRLTEQRSAGQGSCASATADLCVHGDWGRKCPNGCRMQGLMSHAEKDIGKRIGDLTERLARLGRLYTQVHTDFRAVSDTSGQTLNEHNELEVRYSEVLRELERRIIHLQRRINMQLQQLTLLQHNIKTQVSQILRVELDIDVALRTCKGSCARYLEYRLDKEKNLQLEKAASYIANLKFERFEEVVVEETLNRRVETSSHAFQPTHGQGTPQPGHGTHSLSATSSITSAPNFVPHRQPTYVDHGRLSNPNEVAHSASSSSTHTSSSSSPSQPVSPDSAFPLPGSNTGTSEWDFNFHDESTPGNGPRDEAAASSSAHSPSTASHHTATSTTSFSSGTSGKDVAPLGTGVTHDGGVRTSGSLMDGGSSDTGTGGVSKTTTFTGSAQGGSWSTGGSTATNTGSAQGGSWSTGGRTEPNTGSAQGGSWSTGGRTEPNTGSAQGGSWSTGGRTEPNTGSAQGGSWSTGGRTEPNTGSAQGGSWSTGGRTEPNTGSAQGGSWGTGGSTATNTGSAQGGGWGTGGRTEPNTGSAQGGSWSTGGRTEPNTGSAQGGSWSTGGSTATNTGSAQGGGWSTGGRTEPNTGSAQGGSWGTGGSTATNTGSAQGGGWSTGGRTEPNTGSAQGGGGYAAGGTGAQTGSGSTSTHSAHSASGGMSSLDMLPALPDFGTWDMPDHSDIFSRRRVSTSSTTSSSSGGGHAGAAAGGGGDGASRFGSLFTTDFGPEFHEEFRSMLPGASRLSSSSSSSTRSTSSTSGGKVVTESVVTKVLSNGTTITHHTKHVSTSDGTGAANDGVSPLLTGRKTRAARSRRAKATRP
ncbi:fibrinogen alpha-1 chain [Petromyzon marinus]|uniref:fibrinogen alpha-1 chain n=1 Tax=Petromyzon marinus TaxID=7757 RepID=UPI003F6F2918